MWRCVRFRLCHISHSRQFDKRKISTGCQSKLKNYETVIFWMSQMGCSKWNLLGWNVIPAHHWICVWIVILKGSFWSVFRPEEVNLTHKARSRSRKELDLDQTLRSWDEPWTLELSAGPVSVLDLLNSSRLSEARVQPVFATSSYYG